MFQILISWVSRLAGPWRASLHVLRNCTTSC